MRPKTETKRGETPASVSCVISRQWLPFAQQNPDNRPLANVFSLAQQIRKLPVRLPSLFGCSELIDAYQKPSFLCF